MSNGSNLKKKGALSNAPYAISDLKGKDTQKAAAIPSSPLLN
ncbi:MAG: hypothetical protein VKL41_20160 [Snowella sp.]|nr:hypothetical protein [Snowella sp.]